MIGKVFTTAERSFWQMVNPMLAKSGVVRKTIQQGAGLAEKLRKVEWKKQFVILAAAGWIIGMLGGAILAVLI